MIKPNTKEQFDEGLAILGMCPVGNSKTNNTYVSKIIRDLSRPCEIKGVSLSYIIWLRKPTVDERSFLLPQLIREGEERELL